jgi:hypothetical protein
MTEIQTGMEKSQVLLTSTVHAAHPRAFSKARVNSRFGDAGRACRHPGGSSGMPHFNTPVRFLSPGLDKSGDSDWPHEPSPNVDAILLRSPQFQRALSSGALWGVARSKMLSRASSPSPSESKSQHARQQNPVSTTVTRRSLRTRSVSRMSGLVRISIRLHTQMRTGREKKQQDAGARPTPPRWYPSTARLAPLARLSHLPLPLT